MPASAATKPCYGARRAQLRVAAAASSSAAPLRRASAGPSRLAPSAPGGALRSLHRRGGTIKASALNSSSNASSTAAPSIGSISSAASSSSALLALPDAFALLGVNRAAARASVIQAYDEAAGNEIELGFSKSAIAARAVVLKAAADVLLEPQDRLAHERGLLPLSEAISEGGGKNGSNDNSLVIGALMLSREAASRAPNAATGARASAEVAARGEALLSAVSGASRGVLSGRSGAAAARDASLATALAHLDVAAALLAADGGKRSGASASARLARAVELLDEYHGAARGGETAALRSEAARALEEMTMAATAGGSFSPAASSAAAAPRASATAAAAAASSPDTLDSPSSSLASAADVLASSFSAADRRVALDALCRAVVPLSSSSASASGEESTRPALMAAWLHLTAEEQVELLDAAEAGTKKKSKKSDGDNAKPSPVPAAAAAAALVAAAVCRGSPSLVARAARLLDAEAALASAKNAPPPSSAARAARVAAALMLGDVASAEAAVGVSALRQLSNSSSTSFSSVPDPRLVAFVSSHDPRDPLPGLCALAEAWVREAALGGCRPPSSPSLVSSPADFSLSRWASSPAVALRLAAGEQASAARAAAGAARRAASGVGGAVATAAAGVRSLAGALVSSLRLPKAGGGSEEQEGGGEREDEVGAAYRARFYGSDGEEEEEEEMEVEDEEEGEIAAVAAVAAPLPPRRRASPAAVSASSASSLIRQQLPPLPIEAAKAKTVGELAAAYERATDARAWRSSPLPPDAVRPLEGEDDLWLGTAAARGNSALPLFSSSSLSLARAVAGGVLLLGAAFAVSRAAGPSFSSSGRAAAAAAPVATATTTAAAASVAASALSAKEAKALLASFQAAKALACGPSSSPDALDKVLSGKLLAEWKGRRRDLEGWTLSYKTKTLKVVEVVPSSSASSARGGLFASSSDDNNEAVFLARIEEKVTLRDEEGLVVDESDAGYDARFVAERKADGEWKLRECFSL